MHTYILTILQLTSSSIYSFLTFVVLRIPRSQLIKPHGHIPFLLTSHYGERLIVKSIQTCSGSGGSLELHSHPPPPNIEAFVPY